MTHEEMRANIDSKLYDVNNGQSDRDFFEDLCELFELDPKDPLSTRMYFRAWDQGHACGYHEVYCHFHGLVGVFKG